MKKFQILNLIQNVKKNFSTSATRRLEFNEQHRALQATVSKIVENDINPFVNEWEKCQQFDARLVFKKFGNAGLLGLTRSTDYNGQGLDYSFTIAMYEEISKKIKSSGVLMSLAVQTDMALPALSSFGSEELKKSFLAPSIAGDFIACVGVTEPSTGSDVAAIKTTAKQKGGDLVINGEKSWITNGIQGDWICLLANTGEDKERKNKYKNKSLIVVPLNEKGITRTKINKLGNKSSDNAIISFDNVRVPVKNVIGELNMGFIYQMLQFQDERLVIGPMAYGAFQQILNSTIDYCKQRKAFGKPIIDNQVVHFRLAELQTEIELLKALTHEAAERYINGENVTYQASMVKLKAGRLGRELVDACLQYFGAMGYSDEVLISRAFRDIRVLSIAGGTDEIMLKIIAKFMNILPKED